jgi:hypothetical protein
MGGLPGYNTSAYYFPQENVTIVALVNIQAEKPPPGVSNAIFKEIAEIMTPENVPFIFGKHARGHGAPSRKPLRDKAK